MLAIAVGILSVTVLFLIVYIVLFESQLRSINRQLNRRLTEYTRQPVSLQLIDRGLNRLTVNINRCLKAEELLRLESIREEKHFKEMIADISHDLRTPLTAIKGYMQLMEKDGLSDKQRQRLSIAQRHADELGGLIELFFEYSYLVNAAPELNIERVNLTNLVAECLAESVAVFEQNNLTVDFNEVPPVFAAADREMTTRIIRNLCRNCVQHSAGEIKVRLKASQNAVISFSNPVKNDSEIDVKRLFDRFYTADSARSKSTGLGLSIVRLLAEQMGGSARASLKEDIIEICVALPNSTV